MYVITFKYKPATLEKLYAADGDYNTDHYVDDLYLAAPTRSGAIALYLHYFGFTWKERAKGIEVNKLTITKE